MSSRAFIERKGVTKKEGRGGGVKSLEKYLLMCKLEVHDHCNIAGYHGTKEREN